jgi:dUTP pyrophosphatase
VAPIVIKVKKLYPDAKLPVRATTGAAGFDVFAWFPESSDRGARVGEGWRQLVRTGLAVAVPDGYELQVRSRSGLALKKGLVVANSPGTVDSDYRGELCVIILNTNPPAGERHEVWIEHGERIAQLVVTPVPQVEYVEVDELDTTERGEGGFGSTDPVV